MVLAGLPLLRGQFLKLLVRNESLRLKKLTLKPTVAERTSRLLAVENLSGVLNRTMSRALSPNHLLRCFARNAPSRPAALTGLIVNLRNLQVPIKVLFTVRSTIKGIVGVDVLKIDMLPR